MSIPQATSQLQEAQALYEAGKQEQAIRLLKSILEQEPNNMEARELLGDIYYAREQYTKARRQYRYIFDRRRHAVEAALKLAEVYLAIPNKLRQAYNVLQRTVTHNPDHLTALLRYANFCRVLINDDEDVEALYQRVEELSAGDLEKELTCAADHLFTGQLERAQAACERALTLAPEDHRVHRLRYQIYLLEENLEQAEAAAQQVLALEGPTSQGYQDLATVYLHAERMPAALEALTHALDWAATLAEQLPLLCQIATLQMQQGQYTAAVERLEQALALDASDPATLYTLVVAHQQLTDYVAALEVLESRLLPVVGAENPAARQLQGILYLQAQDFAAARDVFASLVEADAKNAHYHYYLALAEDHLGHTHAARQAVCRALRCDRRHAEARALYDQLHTRPSTDEEETSKPQPAYFDPLDLHEFLTLLDIQVRIDKLVAYIEMRYWKERDPRGKKPQVAHRTIVLMQIAMGIKDWNLHQLYQKLRSRKHGGPLRRLLGLKEDPEELPDYTTFERRLNNLGVYPLKFLMRQWVREAVREGYIDVSNVLLDTTLIAAHSDLKRFAPDSPTGYSDPDGAWSYPKPWTGRVFGFKLSLATAKEGEPIDADLVTANLNDITLGKQAVRRLARTFAPLDIDIEFVIGDSGYCSNPLRQLVGEVLGAMPLFHFNPRNGAQRQACYTYLDDPDEWLKAKRCLRQLIERSFAQLKQHFGLNNLRIRGLVQVAQYILSRCLAYLACVIVAHKVGRPDLKASPNRLLYSY